MKRFVREPVNGLTHFAGAVLAVAGLVWLLVDGAALGGAVRIVALTVFGVTMILLYMSSTLYHSLHVSERFIAHLRRVDHMMIFLFIAGTYTPFCLVTLGGAWGWSLFAAVWTLAAIGIALKVVWMHAPRGVTVLLYLGMGWLGVIGIRPIVASLPPDGVALLATGGLLYTVGAIVYATKRPNLVPDWFGFHEIWHLFVLAGSFAHFWVIRTHIAAVA